TITDAVRPDLLIKGTAPSDLPYIAGGLFELNAVAGNTLLEKVARQETATFTVSAQNQGTARNPLVLKSSETDSTVLPDGAAWAFSYFVGDTDITAQIKSAGGYTTQELEPGAAEIITVKVTPNANVTNSLHHYTNITAYLPDGTTACDLVRADAQRIVRQP